MDVLLCEVNGAFHTLDVLVSPIQMLAFALNLPQLRDHLLSTIDTLIDDGLKLTDEFFNAFLHFVHGIFVNSLGQLALYLKFLLRQFGQLFVLHFDLTHQTINQTLLDLLLSLLLHGHDLTLHQANPVLPLLNR